MRLKGQSVFVATAADAIIGFVTLTSEVYVDFA